MNNYQLLIEKLDAFIRKYYKNQLLRGVIYTFTLCLAFYLLVTASEYFGHFSTTFRTVLFYVFVLGNAFVLGKYIVVPLTHLYRIGKIISHEQAAQIIGIHFTEVKDKLLNILQLKKQADNSNLEPQTSNLQLIEASINQKASELKPIPFANAVNMNENRKYARYALIPLLAFVLILFASPSLIKDGTKRLMAHNTYFEKPAPFVFELLNKDLKTVQQEDYRLDVKVTGNEVPDNAYIEIDNNQFKLEKDNTVNFHYMFKNLQKSVSFRLLGDGHYSKEYTLEANPNPVLMNFEIALEYPAYIKKQNEKIQNTGDLVVPAGTKVSWLFNTMNTDAVKLSFQDTTISLNRRDENHFNFVKRFMRNDSYSVSTSNEFLHSKDSIRYSVAVIPDIYPSIGVDQQKDSLSSKRTYFKGVIKDDYGFTKLTFNYRYLKSSDSLQTDKNKVYSVPINFNKTSTQDQFFYLWDVSDINVAAGDEIEYFFEVSDNDGLAGPKSTRSQTQVFKAPSMNDIAENTEKNNEAIKSDLQQSIAEAKKLEKDMSDLSKKLLDKKELSWEDKKKAEDMIQRQKELENKIADVSKKNEKNNTQQSEYKNVDKNLLDKQAQLEDLMKKLMTEDMKKLMAELQKMLEQSDKQQLKDQIDKMKLSSKDMEKELDRSLALFKQLEFEQKLQDNIDKLNDLAKKQDDLGKESDKQDADKKSPELKDKQDSLNKMFDKFKDDMKELEKKNSELETPNKMDKTDEEQKDIKNDMQNSEQQLGESKAAKASKSQKSAAKKMEQLAQKMDKMKEGMKQEQEEEDMAALRALLENLLKLSFDQEKLMTDLKTMDINNPQYLKASQEQRNLKDDAKMIEDSLFALSKRVIQIKSIVNQEIGTINLNMSKALDNMEDRQVPLVRSNEQYIMTSTNNLALMLSETLSQMQQAAASSSPSNSPASATCKKPGMGKPSSAGQLRKMQQELNAQLQKMKDGMKPGPKPGQKGQTGQGGMSEELAKMAAQQEYIRNELNKLNQSENKDGKGSLGDLDQMQQKMEETEKDIVNKMITEETMKRQADILTRLLESERAEQQRDQDEERKSEEAKNYTHRNPNGFEEYKLLKQKEVELLKTVPPSLSPYYKKKVDDYFQNIEK